MQITQRQFDRVATTVICGVFASCVGVLVLLQGGPPLFITPLVAFYAAWMASGFDRR
jgi:hypothetical protein